MDIQLVLLALLLIIGTYELISLSTQPTSEEDMSIFWKKTFKNLRIFEKE